MILAGGLVTALATRLSVPRLFTGGIAGLAVCVGLLSIAPGPLALLAILFAVGWFVMPVQATTMTIIQQATTDRTRGRVAGALNAAIQTATIGSMAAAGILADVIGMRMVFAIGSVVVLLAAVVAWAAFRGEAVRPAARSGALPAEDTIPDIAPEGLSRLPDHRPRDVDRRRSEDRRRSRVRDGSPPARPGDPGAVSRSASRRRSWNRNPITDR